MATATYGRAGVPSTKTLNLDYVFAQSLAASRKTMEDNITSNNALWHLIKKNGTYESQDGGTNIEAPLRYANNAPDTYSGYDTLDVTPIDGVTKALFDWRDVSTSIIVSHKERRENAQRIINLVETKLQQASDGMQEFIPTMLFQGNGAGALNTPRVSSRNGSLGITPLGQLVPLDPTTGVIGNIDPATETWWQSQQTASTATTYDALLREVDLLIANAGKGTGGKPDLLITDLTTFITLKFAIYQRNRSDPQPVANFPFESVSHNGTAITWDEKVPDLSGGGLDATASGALGTMWALNSKYFKVIYDSETNFKMRPFMEMPLQNAKAAHIFWRGNTVMTNRRKHGVLTNISRGIVA